MLCVPEGIRGCMEKCGPRNGTVGLKDQGEKNLPWGQRLKPVVWRRHPFPGLEPSSGRERESAQQKAPGHLGAAHCQLHTLLFFSFPALLGPLGEGPQSWLGFKWVMGYLSARTAVSLLGYGRVGGRGRGRTRGQSLL